MTLTRIGDFLKRSKIPVIIEDDKEYNRVTIRINHNGVSLRDTEIGKKIGTKSQFIIKEGQFIVSKIDARYGAFGIIPNEVDKAIITGNFWAYDVDFSKLNIEWFNQFTNSPDFYDICERASSGITHRKYLNENFFLNYKINLPSIGDQLIQIEKIKNQKISFSTLSSELNFSHDVVKQLRQAFLREAMQGKLVEQDSSDEPASELLRKIKAEKEKLISEKKLKKEEELPAIKEEEIPFDIPENWVWCRLGDLITLISGQDLSPNEYSDSDKIGIPYITGASNLDNGKVILNRWTKRPRALSYAGDLLITCKGSGVGKLAILNEPKVHIARQLMAIRPIQVLVSFFRIILLLHAESYKSSAKSSIPGIDRDIVLKTMISLPPLPEQHRIVAKLEELMKSCDALEASIKESKEQNERLLQQVLREALRGDKRA